MMQTAGVKSILSFGSNFEAESVATKVSREPAVQGMVKGLDGLVEWKRDR